MSDYYTQRQRARALRTGMTDAEQHLWHRIRRRQLLGVQFCRQRPLGPYIADFFAPVMTLVVELDGGQHFEAEALAYDHRRDAWMRAQGIRVLRFDNRQVLLEMDNVLEKLLVVMQEQLAVARPASPSISLRKRRGKNHGNG